MRLPRITHLRTLLLARARLLFAIAHAARTRVRIDRGWTMPKNWRIVDSTASFCDSALRATACNAPRHRWHLRQRRGLCKLQNPLKAGEFESHSLRQTVSAVFLMFFEGIDRSAFLSAKTGDALIFLNNPARLYA
jgi:hypothetical protein